MITDYCYISFVNLDHRTDRLHHMLSEFSRIGMSAERTPGLNPKDFPEEKYSTMRNRTPGAIGCHMAHVSIMKKALEENKHAFVMEDDLVFCSDFKERLEHITKFTEAHEWDVIWLGGTFHSPAFWHPVGPSKMHPNCSANIGVDCVKTSDPRMMRTYGAFCTYAYIVNVNSIHKILDLLDAYVHQSIGIDWLFIKLQPQLKTYAYVPGCVKQLDIKSDIGSGLTIFSGFSKLNGNVENSRYWWQDRKEDFNPHTFEWR